jgi:hypothetical protein
VDSGDERAPTRGRSLLAGDSAGADAEHRLQAGFYQWPFISGGMKNPL